MASIGIIGAGHVGCALAFDLASRGHNVVIRAPEGHPGSTAQIKANSGNIDATGLLSGRVRVCVGNGLSQLTETILIVAVPGPGHDPIIRELRQHDLSNKIIIFIAGNAVTFTARAALQGEAKAVLATATSPFSSRISGDGSVSVRGIKKRLQICVLSTEGLASPQESDGVDQDVSAQLGIDHVFPMPLLWSASALDIFLTSVNGVMHVPTALMNLGWIETTNGDFLFYRHGMSQGVCRIMEALDQERLAVAAAYDCSIDSALATMNANYGTKEATLRDFVAKSTPHNKTKGVQKRFLEQDVPYWLVLCSDLGARAGVPTPSIDSLITLASTLSGKDYRKTGITLGSLGLGTATRHEVYQAFRARSWCSSPPQSSPSPSSSLSSSEISGC
ncbi:hypothetical protein E4U14_003461 [Claviceps sp. LM454 group G7]|nr:hypothetical protein E4U14_003461 [Claviceps sp. LM454 group G7]